MQYKDFVNAAQEGFDHVELMKRYSTFGMGPTQGKLANLNAIRMLAQDKGQTVPETGVTTSRPFFHPVSLGHLAGRGFHPHRHTPLHERHVKLGTRTFSGAEASPSNSSTPPVPDSPSASARSRARRSAMRPWSSPWTR